MRSGRRRRVLLVAAAIVFSLLALVLAVGLTLGFEGLWRFLSVPSIEATGGVKYTPQGAVRRYIEKLDEKGGE
jgi:hypothetical protein